MVNPLALDDFIKDGVKITSLYSPLVTALTAKILQDNSSLSQDAEGLYKVNNAIRVIELGYHIYDHRGTVLTEFDNGAVTNSNAGSCKYVRENKI